MVVRLAQILRVKRGNLSVHRKSRKRYTGHNGTGETRPARQGRALYGKSTVGQNREALQR